jgi:hypothetical protein
VIAEVIDLGFLVVTRDMDRLTVTRHGVSLSVVL